ncbi:hypothetical protein L2E82_06978 [Cichorium intybus]|uniref:Uncharacterized protein n=1 Tax=Cichorium intybus TaxID=13427 RepID=A0ACB9G494_CICIN|nr:hypothetical protein L2E82_06978 [Cichorium intybus]
MAHGLSGLVYIDLTHSSVLVYHRLTAYLVNRISLASKSNLENVPNFNRRFYGFCPIPRRAQCKGRVAPVAVPGSEVRFCA